MGMGWSDGYYPDTTIGYLTSGPNRRFVMYPENVRVLEKSCSHCGTKYVINPRLKLQRLIERKAAYRKAMEEKTVNIKNEQATKPFGWKDIFRRIKTKNSATAPCSEKEFEKVAAIDGFKVSPLPCACHNSGEKSSESSSLE